MAVRIRLKRMGAKKIPFYRLVVADARAPRDGRFIAEVGYYNPSTEPITLKVDEEKVLEWLEKGAQPSETVKRLLNQTGVLAKHRQMRQSKREGGEGDHASVAGDIGENAG